MNADLIPAILIVDTNILISGVRGQAVRLLLDSLQDRNVTLLSTEGILREVVKHFQNSRHLKQVRRQKLQETVEVYKTLILWVDTKEFLPYKQGAQARLAVTRSDRQEPSNDWQLTALALRLREENCAILSEDKDFHGIGIPVWTSEKLRNYLSKIDQLLREGHLEKLLSPT